MVIYNSGDSDLLIQTLSDNLKSSKEIFKRINKGTQHLNSVIDSGTLSGAAYRAGQSLFQAYISPMIQKLGSAIADIQGDLNSYKSADKTVRAEGTHLDEAQLMQKLANTNQLIQLVEQKIEEDKKVLQKFMASGFEGVAQGLAELPNLDGQLNNLKHLKQDYEKKMSALQTFSSATNSLFTDSIQAFKYALQGVDIIKQSKASSDGTITFPAGANMSWSSNLQGVKFGSKLADTQDKNSLPASEIAKIKDIQNNTSLSISEKANKIAEIYEFYLYSLDFIAFDTYDNIRKKAKDKYGDKFKDSEEFKNAESELTKRLQELPVNIKQIAQKMGEDNLKNTSKGMKYFQFYNMVKTNSPFDLKNRQVGESQYSIWSRGWKGNPLQDGNLSLPSPDYLGNYLYGYYGQGALSINGESLKYGAGVAQQFSDFSNGKLFGSWNWYGDNPGDSEVIQDGINAYNKRHKNN